MKINSLLICKQVPEISQVYTYTLALQKLTAAVIVIWQGKIFMVHFPMSPRTDAHFTATAI